MNWDYINDATDPRGVEYAATRRGARAARATQQNTEDMLELQLADATGDRVAVGQRIRARRNRQAASRAWWSRVDVILSILFVAAAAWFMFAPDSGAVRGGAPVSVQRVPDASRAPVRSATPDNSGDMIDSAFCVNHSADSDPQNCLK